MSTNLGLVLVGVAGLALAALCVWSGDIGVRGSSVDKTDNPVLYWSAVVGLCVASVAALVLDVFGK